MRDVTFREAQNLRVVTPPSSTDLPFTIEELRAHCIVEHTEHDELLKRFARVARNYLNAPRGILGRSVSRQTLRLDLPCFWFSPLRIPCGPLVAVSSVKYYDDANVQQTVSPSDYFLDEDQLLWAETFQEPSHYTRPGAVRVEYTAGFENAAAIVAAGFDPIVDAMMKMISHWYRNRDAVAVAGEMAMMPAGVDMELTPFRVLG